MERKQSIILILRSQISFSAVNSSVIIKMPGGNHFRFNDEIRSALHLNRIL